LTLDALAVPDTVHDLQVRVAGLMPRDQARLRRRLEAARKARGEARDAALTKLEPELVRAEAALATRRGAVPAVSYPAELPISAKVADIQAAIRDHQVVIVAGETGSGKTTQLPKMCLELGRGVLGVIGHTQPRRIAARTVAERVAAELSSPLGDVVGYQVRFTDRTADRTLVKLMTDGILLAEIQRDRLLRRYDTLIIDEAHERSLNIDFILGYLGTLLPRRPDLKVIITSATIDPERFSRHFGDAPVIEVSGRTYPVEIRYRPLLSEVDGDGEDEPAAKPRRHRTPGAHGLGGSRGPRRGGERAGRPAGPDRDQIDAICDAVSELDSAGRGDILVFLSGEREIRDTADALNKLDLPGTEVLPLYARLSAADQHRVFQAHSGRRIVLATNVAETSLTVPGIKYVVDPGTARISRYSHRTKVQRLPIEAISQASANQRAGRCGRTSDGICIRLYAEDDFAGRPEFTEPEILRTNLASVILQMAALGLGDVAAFGFIDPPDRRNIADGIRLLIELGALEPGSAGDPKLTAIGRKLAQLPIDPRLARMVLAGADNGCLAEVLVIAAALSIQDPRERPVERQQAADTAHRRFADPSSDFLAWLNLWRYLGERQEALSSSAFRRLCTAEFLHYLRVREWQDLVGQLRQIARGLDLDAGEVAAEPDSDLLHQALLAGLLSHLGRRDGDRGDYDGARGARFAIFPGSALFGKPPRFVMAAELVETSRLWARVVARIEPEWAERIAGDLVVRNYSEPHWSAARGAVLASERVTLFGVPLVTGRQVNYGRIDPVVSRELFIRHALVEGQWRTHHAFFHANRELLEDVGELEHRARRRDILVDEQTLYDFYDKRVGAGVVSARHFDTWWKKTRRADPDLLTFTRELVVNPDAAAVTPEAYPDEWRQDGLTLPLRYAFEPGTADDGVTVAVPLALLNRVRAEDFLWQVPGLREELVTALIRSLPKALRRNFVPAPDVARAALAGISPDAGGLLEALGAELRRLTGVTVPRDAWGLDGLPAHLRVTFEVHDERDKVVGTGKDLDELAGRLKPKVRAAIAATAPDIERTGLTAWTIGTLPRRYARAQGANTVHGYPALVDEGATVALRVLASEAEQAAAMRAGTRRLLLLNTPSPARYVAGQLSNRDKLQLQVNPHGSVAALLADCAAAAADQIVAEAGGPAWDEAGFAALLAESKRRLAPLALAIARDAERVLAAAAAVRRKLGVTYGPALRTSTADIESQVDGIVHNGFISAAGAQRLPDLARYLTAADQRLSRLPDDPGRDLVRLQAITRMTGAYEGLLDRLPPARRAAPEVEQIRWMIEELRVSVFAQQLGTAYPVSEQRILRAIHSIG
jgi:ATP-dependent helicase HrpA